MGPGTGTASCSIRNAKCFCPPCPHMAFWKPTCTPSPDPALVVARVQQTLFLAKVLREWGAFPRCPQTALKQTNVGSLGELLHRTPFPVLEKPSFLQPGLRWAVGTPTVHQAVFGASSCAPRPYSAPLTHTAWARLKSPLLHSDAGALPGWKQAH